MGAGSRNGIEEIKHFARKYRIPVLTTWPGMDLVTEDDELYCGRPGSIPSSWAPNFINVETDFLLVFGARLDLGQVGYNPLGFAPNAKVVRIDVDEEEFTRMPVRDNWLNFCLKIENAKSVLERLISINLNVSFVDWWVKIEHWKGAYPRSIGIKQEFRDGISSYKLIKYAAITFSGKNIVTGNSGTCMEMLLQSWQVQKGQRIVNSCGLGSMGFAIPAAIGVAIKTHATEVICVESDGSLAMNLQDLVTMMDMNTTFKIIVMDSSGYKSISLSQARLGQFEHGNSKQTNLNLPNTEKIALAMGFSTRELNYDNDIESGVEWLASQKTSSILFARVSRIEDALPRLISKPNSLGVMETPPMNELSPKI